MYGNIFRFNIHHHFSDIKFSKRQFNRFRKIKIILKISSIPIFFLYSFFIGKIIKKRGLLIGITLTIIYLSISISILNANKDLNILNIIFIIIKTLSLNFGAIIGVNRNYKKASLQTN